MAVQIEFEGLGDKLLASFKAQREAAVALKTGVDDANASIQKGAQQNLQAVDKLNQSISTSAQLVAELGNSAKSGGASQLSKDATSASNSTKDLTANLVKAQASAAQLVAQQKQIKAEIQGVNAMQAKGTITQAQSVKLVDQLSKEYAEVTTQLESIGGLVNEGSQALGQQAPLVKSLRQEFAEAKNEAAQMIAQFGEFSPEAIQATQRAADLKDQIGDLNQRLDALHPDAKIGAFARFGTVLASGAQALGGFVSAFSDSGGPIQEAALKLQSFVLGLQGAKEFLGGFQDAFKDIRAAVLSFTTAQNASTASTKADIVAKTGQATATSAATVATGGLTTAFRAFTAVLAANPIGAVVTAIGLVVAAISFLTDEEEDATAGAQALLDTLQKVEKIRFTGIDFQESKDLIESERKAIESGNTALAERQKILRDAAIQDVAALERVNELTRQREEVTRDVIEANTEIGRAGREATDEEKKALDELLAKQEDISQRLAEISNERQLGQKKLSVDLLAFDQEEQKKRVDAEREAAKERKELRERLAQDILALEKQIAQQVQQAQLAAADPRERLALEQRASEQEIQQLRENLLRKLAIVELEKELGTKAIKELSDAELNARADALIQQRNLQLPESSNSELAKLSLLAQQEFARKSVELTRQETETRIQLIQDAGERELAAFQLTLDKKLEELRKAGATEADILQFQAQQQQAFAQQQALKAFDQEEQISLARIEAQRQGAEGEVAFRQRIELEKLAVQEQFAQARLAAIASDGTAEGELLRAQLEKTLSDIARARAEILSTPVKVNIFDLLGITNEDGTALTDAQKAQLNQDFQIIKDSISNIIGSINEAQIAEVEARIDATDKIIEDAHRRRDELQSQLEQEKQDQANGLASNVDAIQAAVDAQSAIENKALAEKKRLVAERQKLARQQAVADAISQTSSLITAEASLIAEAAKGGITGVFAGIAAGLALISAFLSFKAKIRAATADTGGQSFRKGGYKSPFIMDGPSHENGGLSIVTPNGKKVAEAEGREALFFVRRENASRALPILQAVNEADWAKTARLALEQMTGDMGIELEPTVITKLVKQKEQLQAATVNVSVQSNKNLERGVRDLAEEVRGFRKDSGARPEVETLPDGSRRERKGALKRTSRTKR